MSRWLPGNRPRSVRNHRRHHQIHLIHILLLLFVAHCTEYQCLNMRRAWLLLQKGQKTDVVTVLVKLDFGERTIGESAKVDCLADQESEVNYSATLAVSSDDALLIDEIASKPLLCMLTLLINQFAIHFIYFRLPESIY